jgi:glycine oxidase
MLAPQIEAGERDPLFELGLVGRDRYDALAEELAESTGLDIGLWREGIARVATDELEGDALKSKVAWQRQEGHVCDWLDAEEVHGRWPWIGPVAGALWAPRDGALDPGRLVTALLADATRRGAQVVIDRAVRLERRGDRVVGVVGRERYTADQVIVAAGAWSGRIEGLPRPLSVEPVRGEMMALPWPAGVRRSILYNRDCYVVARGGEALAGSTMEYAGFEATVTESGQRRILASARLLCPPLGAGAPLRSWAGLRPVSPDGLPLVGAAPDVEGLWYATGHGRNGILLAAITGTIMSQLIAGEPTLEDVSALDPARMWTW